MKNQEIFEQVTKLSAQLESLAETHRKAIKVLISYKSASGRLAHAIDNNETERAASIRDEVKVLREEYFNITMVLLFNDNI